MDRVLDLVWSRKEANTSVAFLMDATGGNRGTGPKTMEPITTSSSVI